MQNKRSKALSLLLALALCAGTLPAAAAVSFSDVPSTHWAAGYISYVVDKGLFAGTSATTFSPDGKITQAQMSVVLGRYAKQDVENCSPWYQKGMDWASSNGIISTRQPDHQLTREEFADMMYQFAKYAKKDTTIRDGVLDGYVDASSLSGSYAEAMRWAVSVGLITGTDTTHLSPKNLVTRAQVATMLTRYDGGKVEQPAPAPVTPEPQAGGSLFSVQIPGSTHYKYIKADGSFAIPVGHIFHAGISYANDYTKSDPDFYYATYTNSNPDVVDINEYNTCRAVSVGTATITATSNKGQSVSLKVVVEAGEKPIIDTPHNTAEDARILQVLEQIQAEYPTNSYWGYDTTYTDKYGNVTRACDAFVKMCRERLYGECVSAGRRISYNELRVGDTIEFSHHISIVIGRIDRNGATMLGDHGEGVLVYDHFKNMSVNSNDIDYTQLGDEVWIFFGDGNASSTVHWETNVPAYISANDFNSSGQYSYKCETYRD